MFHVNHQSDGEMQVTQIQIRALYTIRVITVPYVNEDNLQNNLVQWCGTSTKCGSSTFQKAFIDKFSFASVGTFHLMSLKFPTKDYNIVWV